MFNLIGKALISLVGLMVIAGAAGLVWYIYWAQLTTWLAVAGALACAALFGFLGLTLTVAPWRERGTGDA
jgi:hypothetical protein